MDTAVESNPFLPAWERLCASVPEAGNRDAAASREETLVRSAAAGDDDAFRLLVESHQERIYRFCHQWLPDAEDAREATQDTFVRAYEAIGRYRQRGKFSTWLFRIALNQCRDRHRSRAARNRRQTAHLEETEARLACHRPPPDEAAAVSGEMAALWRGIEALPPSLRDALILRCIEGLDQDDCAAILDCSARAVEGRLYRARRELETWWRRERGGP